MRWYSRADLLPLVLDGLLEGSLVGVGYMALATIGWKSIAPLPFVVFWVAAAAGLALARLHTAQMRPVVSVPGLVLLAGAVGWLADPAARAAVVALRDPLEALAIHPTGWLLGAAVLRGAAHADTKRESDICTDALTFAFPLLGVSLLLHFGYRDPLAAPALVGSVVCIVAGMLAIGHARLREFESIGPVARGGRVWPLISVGLVAVAALAIPVALFIGTAAPEPIAATGRSLGDAGRALLAWAGDQLSVLLSWLAQCVPGPAPLGTPRPFPTPGPGASQSATHGPIASGQLAPWVSVLARIVLVVFVILLALALRWVLGQRRAALLGRRAGAAAEERRREPRPGRLRPRLPRPAFHLRLPGRRPRSAVEAYLALLDELADREELARGPAETPRSHAHRAGGLGLEPLPMGLLAADYQLAVYGGVAISERETARAIGRWQRLRKLARRLPREEDRG